MMGGMTIDELLALIDADGRPVYHDVAALIETIELEDGKWPKSWEVGTLKALNTCAAFRESDKEQLVKVAGKPAADAGKYRVDALPQRIADAWAHYLHGEPARYTPASDSDAERLEQLLPPDWQSELEEAGAVCSSEGEVWPRTYLDPVTGRPETDWLSRLSVLPRFVGKRLAAAAVWTDLPRDGKSKEQYRHFEVHAVGVVVNLLYRGTDSKVGVRVDLDAHAFTDGAPEVWLHDAPVALIDRIPNKTRRNRKTKRTVGVSDYTAIIDQFLDINESMGIGARNMRLSAKQRAVISQAAAAAGRRRSIGGLDDEPLAPEEGHGVPGPRFDTDEEVWVRDPLDTELGSGSEPPFQVLSYEFDAAPLIAWRRELVDTALSRVGLSGQFVGLGDTAGVAYAISGTALRMRLIPQKATGDAKGRYWDDGVPAVLHRMAWLDSIPTEQGGAGNTWADLTKPPTYERAAGIPADPVEEATRLQTLIGAGLQSIESSIRELHPTWSDDDVAKEVAAIRTDREATMPSFGA